MKTRGKHTERDSGQSRPAPAGGMYGQSRPNKQVRAGLTAALVVLALSVVVLGVVAVLLLQRPLNTKGQRGGDRGQTDAVWPAAESAAVPPVSGPDELQGAGTFADPYRLPTGSGGRVVLPVGPEGEDYQFLSRLTDGRAVLLHRQSLILATPMAAKEAAEAKAGTGPEEQVVYRPDRVLAKAAYGVQAAADERYVVWGIGGDEVWELFCYDAETGQTSKLAEDEGGFYGLTILPGHRFYTTRIDYDNMVKVPLAYVSFDLDDSISEAFPAEQSRRNAALDLLAAKTGREPGSWAYEEGKTWSEAYLTGLGDLFEVRLTYVDLAADRFDWQLLEIKRDGSELELGAAQAAAKPEFLTGREWFSCGTKWLYRGRWYCTADGALPLYYEADRPYFRAPAGAVKVLK